MPKSKGMSSPLLFFFCTLSRYLYHSFQHCQWAVLTNNFKESEKIIVAMLKNKQKR